jgi:hypothetical protein
VEESPSWRLAHFKPEADLFLAAVDRLEVDVATCLPILRRMLARSCSTGGAAGLWAADAGHRADERIDLAGKLHQ